MSFQEEVFMKAIINRKTYNTETAEKQGEIFVSVFGDPAGYEESLFKTKKGVFFLYGKGGSESKYKEEAITPLTKEQAEQWKKQNA